MGLVALFTRCISTQWARQMAVDSVDDLAECFENGEELNM